MQTEVNNQVCDKGKKAARDYETCKGEMQIKKIVYVLIIAAFGLTATANALAGLAATFDLYTCGGATFSDGYLVDIDLDSPWKGVAFQAEDDSSGTCKAKKADGFACTRSGNLITSRINDASEFRAFDDSVDNFTLDVAAPGDPNFAVVHADIFDPGECATAFDCDLFGGGTVDCYDSGFGNGPGLSGYYDNAADSCEGTFDNNGEGMFAEGTNFSPNRPKNGGKPHKNWAMWLELDAMCQSGILAVEADATPPTCDSAAITVDGIAGGGDVATAIVAGTVTFTPDTECIAILECEDNDNNTECPEIEKIVFVTSGLYTGDLVTEATNLGLAPTDGLDAGDKICQKLADDALLPGTYTAWLSDSNTDAKDRVSHSILPYVLTNGDSVAANYLDLIFMDGTNCDGGGSFDCLDHMIDRNESQGSVTSPVWSSTTRQGVKIGSNFCDDWTSASSGFIGGIGSTLFKNKNWCQQTSGACNSPRRLYCFKD